MVCVSCIEMVYNKCTWDMHFELSFFPRVCVWLKICATGRFGCFKKHGVHRREGLRRHEGPECPSGPLNLLFLGHFGEREKEKGDIRGPKVAQR